MATSKAVWQAAANASAVFDRVGSQESSCFAPVPQRFLSSVTQAWLALATGTSLLTAGATVGSETGGFGTCTPVVEGSRDFQARAGDELALLPLGSAIAEMLADDARPGAVMRFFIAPSFPDEGWADQGSHNPSALLLTRSMPRERRRRLRLI
ncbi:MAG: hypothetical protein ACOCXK_01530 [Rhodosalinus sp.]